MTGSASQEPLSQLERLGMCLESELYDHHSRCIPYLLRLHLAASRDPLTPLPFTVADEIGEATDAILAEVEAAADKVAAASIRRRATAECLAARVTRLAAAANDAVAAAKISDMTLLRAHLDRVEALTSAVWALQLAISAEDLHAPGPPARPLWR
jgi:hypothetical protein